MTPGSRGGAPPERRHDERTVSIRATAEQVFAFVDDQLQFSAQMSTSSWMMAGSSMSTEVDADHGQRIGSHIRMSGNVLGFQLALDEVVTERRPPVLKARETVGTPRLLVTGNYRMGFELEPQGERTRLRVFIDYDLPIRHRWLGRLFGGMYARWCLTQMAEGAVRKFQRGETRA